MRKLIVNCPLNTLSLGQVSLNILRELHKQNVQVALYPVADVNINAYNRLSEDFKVWLQNSVNNRLKIVDKNMPTLKIWHINGSESRVGRKQYLYSFYECDSPTQEEVNICSMQDGVIFSSEYSANSFRGFNIPATNVPLGFDPDIVTMKSPFPKDVIHWILVGKWEKRKNTSLIINTWARKYGNNTKHQLSLCVSNPFLNEQMHQQFFQQAFGGAKPFNVNILPHLDVNEKMTQLYNSADIDLSGFSKSEGWGLPSFNTTALGKWSIVTNCAGHKDWATKENSILIEPLGKEPCYDGIFFQPNQPFNQGNFFTFSPEQLVEAMETAEKKAKTVNTEGLKLQTTFTYEKTVKALLAKMDT